MNQCPHHSKVKVGLPPMPPRIAALPVGQNGYPIPHFVAEVNGSREDFRIADPLKRAKCLQQGRCWVCGGIMGVNLAFVIGPMYTVNRVSADAFMHLDCAVWSVQACPFLVRPNMVRREDVPEQCGEGAGIMITRNPGVSAIWVTRHYTVEVDERGPLFRLSEPHTVTWWREGRPATRAEVLESMESGLPLLREQCRSPKELAQLEAMAKDAQRFLP